MLIALPRRDHSKRLRCLSGSGVLLALILALAPRAASAGAPERQKQVLVLHSARRDASITVAIDREVPSILSEGLGETIDYYSEYLDQSRFPEPEYFRDFLARKYKDQQFDVVIALQDAAVQFLSVDRDALFPRTPIVFVANGPNPPHLTNATGIATRVNFTGTVRLAEALQPDLQQLFVVVGASPRDRIYKDWASDQLKSFERSLKITYLAGLPIADVEKRLANLPDHSAIYYLIMETDGAGRQLRPLEAVDRLIAAAAAPIYSWNYSALGRGVVGGALYDAELLGRKTGALALRVIRGERADSIPITSAGLNPQVDARQLRRWGLEESRLPAGTMIRFKDPTVWDRYRFYIIGTIVLLGAQAALIAGLVFQRMWRRRAEALAQASQNELQASYGRIRDLAGRLLSAQEAERSRIARELHDDVGQQLALLTIDLELMGGLGTDLPDEAEHVAREALTRAHGVAKSVHALSHRLHPAKLRLIGLVGAITGLQREFSRPSLEISFTHDPLPAAIPHEVTLCIFRIAQEALQNVVKHSAASRVTMRLSADDRALTLTLADDGVGFDANEAKHRGLGLVSMSERVEFIGGTLTIKSRRRAGTRIEIVVPYRDRAPFDSPDADNIELHVSRQ